MNREQRRAFNKAHKTKYTKDDFDIALALSRLKASGAKSESFDGILNSPHNDNEAIAPEGCEVRLNYDDIYSRPQEDITEEFKDWVESHKDETMHLTREGTSNGLVSIVEDVRTTEEDGKTVVKPKWLFDLYCDILLKDSETGEFKHPWEIDETAKTEYTDITASTKLISKYLKNAEKAEDVAEIIETSTDDEDTEKIIVDNSSTPLTNA